MQNGLGGAWHWSWRGETGQGRLPLKLLPLVSCSALLGSKPTQKSLQSPCRQEVTSSALQGHPSQADQSKKELYFQSKA